MTEVLAAPFDARALDELARLHGIERSYTDLTGERRTASPEALLRVLAALGAPVERPEDLPDALREREREIEERVVSPVIVIPEGGPEGGPENGEAANSEVAEIHIQGSGIAECRLTTEDGERHEWTAELPRFRLPVSLPAGYHDLTVAPEERTGDRGDRIGITRIIAAPAEAHDPEERAWGVFLPLYALRTRRSWGTADLRDLEALLEWTAGLGGAAVGTLPLLAAFLDEPCDPSPYAPVSRLFWNELYVDVTAAPELAESAAAREELASGDLARAVAQLRRERRVDYRRAAAVKRRVLEPLAHSFFAAQGWRAPDFQAFLLENPEARGYASFRATCERRREPWRAWPRSLKDGEIRPGDYDTETARYHLYVQWLAARQLEEFAAGRGDNGGAGLYLDLPIGVHPDGYDPWRFPALFADGMSAGAPPDDFFASGQDWGFPPLHPERIREDGYRYVTASIVNLMRHARILRLDHIMHLHRLFWVPRGMGAAEGVYVRYPADELWAILCLESRRHRTAIVGEDLGTVPPEVREAMDRHRARRMYVVPFEIRTGDGGDRGGDGGDGDGEGGLAPVPERSAASLGTHDQPPFAAQWRDMEPARRRAVIAALEREGRLDAEAPRPSDDGPGGAARLAMRGLLRHLAASPARLVVVNLEDLWQEEAPQNVPGTSMAETPNWQRKARYQLETFREMVEVAGTLAEIDRIRRAGAAAEPHAGDS